jgi:transcriptional regulator
VVIFQGAESYITPSWYPSKHDTGLAVPTWNYAVVHAHGMPRAIEDPRWLRHHLSRATDFHEARASEPWKLSDAPPEFVDRLLGAIVGIEMPIRRLLGKWKTSQNRTDADKLGVVAGLLGRGDDRSRAMAELVRSHVSGR